MAAANASKQQQAASENYKPIRIERAEPMRPRLDVVADARAVRRSAMFGFAALLALAGTVAYGAAQLFGIV